MPKAKAQPCNSCRRPGLQTKSVTRSYGKGAALLVIEDIPLLFFPHCGETYLTAGTLHEIERIRTLRNAVSVVRPVAVATFP